MRVGKERSASQSNGRSSIKWRVNHNKRRDVLPRLQRRLRHRMSAHRSHPHQRHLPPTQHHVFRHRRLGVLLINVFRPQRARVCRVRSLIPHLYHLQKPSNCTGKILVLIIFRDVKKQVVDSKGGGDSNEPQVKRAKMINETVTVKDVSWLKPLSPRYSWHCVECAIILFPESHFQTPQRKL